MQRVPTPEISIQPSYIEKLLPIGPYTWYEDASHCFQPHCWLGRVWLGPVWITQSSLNIGKRSISLQLLGLVDRFPSLLRLAELTLQANAGYHVSRIEKAIPTGSGRTPSTSGWGLTRANTVRDFLVKYGARANQIETISRGKAAPGVHNPNPVYSLRM
jgi:hypothetical protein